MVGDDGENQHPEHVATERESAGGATPQRPSDADASGADVSTEMHDSIMMEQGTYASDLSSNSLDPTNLAQESSQAARRPS